MRSRTMLAGMSADIEWRLEHLARRTSEHLPQDIMPFWRRLEEVARRARDQRTEIRSR